MLPFQVKRLKYCAS